MENYGKAAEYAETSLNSAGTAESKFGAYSDGIEAKMNALTAGVEKFSLEFLNSEFVVDIIEDLTEGLESLTDKLWLIEGALRIVFVISMYKAGSIVDKFYKKLTKLGKKVDKNAKGFKKMGASIKGLWATNPVGMIMAIYAAAQSLHDLIMSFIPTMAEARKEALEGVNAINEHLTENKNKMLEAQDAAQKATNALEDNLNAIRELEAKDTLTYIEQVELDKLKEATLELERQQKITTQEATSATSVYYSSLDKSTTELGEKLSDLETAMEGPSLFSSFLELDYLGKVLLNNLNPLSVAIGAFNLFAKQDELEEESDELVEQIQAAIDASIEANPISVLNLEDSLLEKFFPDKQERNALVARALAAAEQMYYDLANMAPELATAIYGSKEEWIKELNNLSTLIFEKYGTLGKASQKEFMIDFVVTGFPQFEETKKQLQELAEKGELTKEALANVNGWKEYWAEMGKYGLNAQNIIDIFNNKFGKTLTDIEKATLSLKTLKEQLEAIKKAYDTLNTAIEEYNSQGFLTYETFMSLLDVEDKFLSALVEENGQIKSNTQALKDLMAAKAEELTIAKMDSYVKNLETAAQNGTLEKVLLLNTATEENTEARIKNIMAIVLNNEALAAHQEQIFGVLEAMANLGSEISLNTDSTKDSKDATEDWEKVLSYANKVLDDHIEKLKEEREAIEKEIEEKIKAKKKEIDLLKEEKEALQDKNEEKNKEIELEELQRNLQKAKQRTMRVYHEDTGWVWEQDPEAIKEAQQELDDFYTEQEIDNIDKRIKALEDEVKALEATTKDTEPSYDKRLKMLDKQIEKAEDYKDKWNEVESDYKQAQNKIVTEARLGADAEEKILQGRTGVFNEFKLGYTSALKEISNKTSSSVSSINNNLKKLDFEALKKAASLIKQINSTEETNNLKSWTDTILTWKWKDILPSNTPNFILDILSNFPLPTLPAVFVGSLIGDLVGKVSGSYASGTLSAKSGLANVDEKGSELIVPKQGRYRMMEYGDTVVPHNLSQRLFDVASNPLRFISNALNSVKTPNLMSNSSRISNASTINIGTIELPSVTNGENFIKQLQLIAANR